MSPPLQLPAPEIPDTLKARTMLRDPRLHRELVHSVLNSVEPFVRHLSRLENLQSHRFIINPATEEMELEVVWTPQAARLRDQWLELIRIAQQYTVDSFLSA